MMIEPGLFSVGARRPAGRVDRPTGKAAAARPDVADLRITVLPADIKHDTSVVRRRVRRQK